MGWWDEPKGEEPEEKPTPSEKWLLQDGVALAIEVENICPEFGCHVALTGGLLYKEGLRKDCDLLFYRIRQTPKIDRKGLLAALAEIGLQSGDATETRASGDSTWVYKRTYQGKAVDLFFPE